MNMAHPRLLTDALFLFRNVHSRSAGLPTIEFLIENKAEHVLLHAFSGNAKNARKGIEAGYYFSIPPSFAIAEVCFSVRYSGEIEKLIQQRSNLNIIEICTNRNDSNRSNLFGN